MSSRENVNVPRRLKTENGRAYQRTPPRLNNVQEGTVAPNRNEFVPSSPASIENIPLQPNFRPAYPRDEPIPSLPPSVENVPTTFIPQLPINRPAYPQEKPIPGLSPNIENVPFIPLPNYNYPGQPIPTSTPSSDVPRTLVPFEPSFRPASHRLQPTEVPTSQSFSSGPSEIPEQSTELPSQRSEPPRTLVRTSGLRRKGGQRQQSSELDSTSPQSATSSEESATRRTFQSRSRSRANSREQIPQVMYIPLE